jgi:hypothetical protein
MSVTGGLQTGTNGYSNSCQNCGHPSHCGNQLRESAYFVDPDLSAALISTTPSSSIIVCHACRCKKCADTDLVKFWKTL